MAEPQFERELQIPDVPGFVRRSWAIQRAGWLAMGLLMVAALLGLTGGKGPLNVLSMGAEAGPLHLIYHSPARKEADTELQVMLHADADGMARLWISRDYIESMAVAQINPEPERVEAAADRLVYTFNTRVEAGQPIRVTFVMQPLHIGTLAGRVGLVSDTQTETAFDFQQFILP